MEYNRSMDTFNFTFNLTQESRNVTFMNEENYVENVAFYITAMVLNLIAVITNLLVVVTISASIKQWKYSMGILMLTLAVCDTVLNLMDLISYILYYSVNRKYFYSNIVLVVDCLIQIFRLIPIFRHLSILLMLAFSLNRYALVCKPFTHHRITSRKSTIIQIIILAVIVVIANIPSFYSSRMTFRIYMICAIIGTVMIYFIPPIITLVLTILVIYELNRSLGTLGASSVSTGARQGERNITRTMVVTIMAFVLLVFPSGIITFVHLIISKNNITSKTLFFTYRTFIFLLHQLLN